MKKIFNFLFVISFLFVFCFNLQAQPASAALKTEAEREQEAAAAQASYLAANRAKLLQEGIDFFNRSYYTSAAAAFNKILAVDPDDTQAATFHALSLSRDSSRIDPARAYLRVLKKHPNYAPANYYLGVILFDAGRADDALPYLRRAIAGGLTDYNLFWASGRAGLFAGSFQTCVEDLTAALEKAKDKGYGARDLYLKRAECNAEAGNREAAKSDFAAAVSHQPGLKWAYSTRIFEDTGTQCKSNADSKYADALKNYQKNKIYEAYRDAHTAIKCDSKHIPSLKLRLKIESNDSNLKYHAAAHGWQLERLENPNAKPFDAPPAEEEKQRLIKTFFESAEKSFAANQPLETIIYVNNVLELEPNNADALLFRARGFVTQPDERLKPLAWRDASAALKINPQLGLAYNVRGLVYEAEKNYAEAVKEFDKALAVNPSEEKPIYNRARMFAAQKQFDKAIDEMNRLIGKNSASTHYYRYRSAVHFDAKQFPEALKDATKAVELDGKNAAARYMLVLANDALGNLAAADDAHLWIVLNNDEAAKATKLQSRPSLKDVQARYSAEIERRKNEEAAARQNEAESRKRQEAANFKYNQQRAVAAYDQAHRNLEAALASYQSAVEKYNRAGEAQYLFKGTLARAYSSLDSARSIINNFLKEHGKYLPRDMYDHLLEDYGKIPSSPY